MQQLSFWTLFLLFLFVRSGNYISYISHGHNINCNWNNFNSNCNFNLRQWRRPLQWSKWTLCPFYWLSKILPVCSWNTLWVHLCSRNSVEWWLKIMWLGSKRNLLINSKKKIRSRLTVFYLYLKNLFDGGPSLLCNKSLSSPVVGWADVGGQSMTVGKFRQFLISLLAQ